MNVRGVKINDFLFKEQLGVNCMPVASTGRDYPLSRHCFMQNVKYDFYNEILLHFLKLMSRSNKLDFPKKP